MATKQEPHVHNFSKLGFIREVGTTTPSELLRVDVAARTVDRIILVRTCECTASEAFECGEAQAMRELYARLTKGS